MSLSDGARSVDQGLRPSTVLKVHHEGRLWKAACAGQGRGETTGTGKMEIVPSVTLLAVHTDFHYCLLSLTIEFSAIKRKEILGGFGRWHITTAQALLVLSVDKLGNSGWLVFPFILMNLGKSNSLFNTYQTGSWGFKRSKQLLTANGETLVFVLSASWCTTEEYPLTITFQRLD